MSDNRSPTVIGPDGGILTEADLPPPGVTRWVPRRKAEIIAAVNGGLLSLTDASHRYGISHEEFRAWVRAYEQSGLLGLCARRARKRSRLTLLGEAHFQPADSPGDGMRRPKTGASPIA